MRGFIYTLMAITFVSLVLIVLLMITNTNYKDYQPHSLLLEYLGRNTLDLIGISFKYENGTVITEKFPLNEYSNSFDLIESFYYYQLGKEVKLLPIDQLKIIGPINITVISYNDTVVHFADNATIVIHCDCNNVSSDLDQGNSKYHVKIIARSTNYTFDGYYEGVINSSSFTLYLRDSNFELTGENITSEYHFPVEGTFLSNIKYSITLDGQKVIGFVKVRT